MAHRLDALLRPRSIAVLGASEREGSVGRRTVENLQMGRYQGELFAVNPGREQVLGVPCYASLAALPTTVEHLVFCIADHRVEQAVEAAIEHGAKALTLMSQLIVEGDPGLSERVHQRLSNTDILVCGPNGMGFYNAHDGVWVCGFDTRNNHVRGGNVTLISHSGSGMAGIIDCEERIDFNLAVSTGSEWGVSMSDYMDFALQEHQPRVIGLFMETAREPDKLIAVLEKAHAQKVPVVAIKVGRTALSAKLAQSHSGAIAGEDAAYQALFDRYGVQRVNDMHEMAATLMLFAQPHSVGQGGIATLHDSGGERQLLIDMAESIGTPVACISQETELRLESLLDPGLPAVNPLDAWGAGGPDADQIMTDCLAAMMEDPNVAMGAVVHDRGPNSEIYPEYLDYMTGAHKASRKPVCLVSNYQGSGGDPLTIKATKAGFPVIDGIRPFLVASKAVLAYRDFLHQPQAQPATLSEDTALQAIQELGEGQPNEAQIQAFLAKIGLPANPSYPAESVGEALSAADQIGYPVVMKTNRQDISHKTEHQGVILNLQSETQVHEAWQDLSRRLGSQVLVAPMARVAGLEMVLGMTRDEQFGPLVMMGFGGTRLEAVQDVVYALPPFDAASAERLVQRLRGAPVLNFDRGCGLPDVAAFCQSAALFSELVALLGTQIETLEMNPVLVHADGCVALDALMIRQLKETTIKKPDTPDITNTRKAS